VTEAFDGLEASEQGLSQEEAARRLAAYGPNELAEKDALSGLAIFLSQFKNPLNLVLAVAAAASYIGGHAIDAVVIVVIIGFNAAMGSVQEYKAEKSIEALRSMSAPEADVLRGTSSDEGGEAKVRVPVKALVPGDVVLLEAGAIVPADCRVIEAMNLEVDEAFLTGESLPVRKGPEPVAKASDLTEMSDMLFAGSAVIQGRGRALVVATGMDSEMGRITELIRESEPGEAPIERRIRDLSVKLGLFAVIASAFIFAVGMIQGLDFFDTFVFAIAAAVSAVPEGLLVVMTIILSVGAFRMAKRFALIRKLNAVETLGSLTAICSDKTGTLTSNQMTVKAIHVDGGAVSVGGAGYEVAGGFEDDSGPVEAVEGSTLKALLEAASLCNDSTIVAEDDGIEVAGEPTEKALVVAALKASIDLEGLQGRQPRVDDIPFNPEKRYMVTFHRTDGGGMRAYAKGAPEDIIGMCGHVLGPEGIAELDQTSKEGLMAANSELAGNALRVLGVAYGDVPGNDVEAYKKTIEEGKAGMTLLGLAGMMDPPRAEVKDAVRLCHSAGIKVIMCTGDHKATAEAVAKEIGISSKGVRTYTGKELTAMSDDELDAAVEDAQVFSRVSPEHKNRIVNALKRNGHVAAMTGDGVNDAPALKSADVGIAMGVTGTDVTKEVAEMVLTDDNFATIVNAVEEGRVVFENVRKVVQYLITTNAAEVMTLAAAIVLFHQHPLILLPVMILWINLVTDGFFDKTLALEGREGGMMERPPRRMGENIIDGIMVRNLAVLGLLMAAGTLFIFNSAMAEGDAERARTLAFATLAMFQVWNALNCRSRTESVFSLGVRSNKYFHVALVASLGLLYLATESSILQTALGTVSLSLMDWLTVLAVSSSVFVIGEMWKFASKRAGSGNPLSIAQ